MVGSLRVFGALAAMCCTVNAQAAGPTGRPYFFWYGHFVTRPSAVIDLSGTNSFEIGGSHWSQWGLNGASARTTYYVNLCKPDCARGRYAKQPAVVRFSGVTRCRGKQVFTNYVVRTTAGRVLLTGSFRALGYLARC